MTFESTSCATLPSTAMRMRSPPQSRGAVQCPSANRHDEQLSATTSGSEKYLKPLKRESSTSSAGVTLRNASSASSREMRPLSARPVRKAISGSILGCTPSLTRTSPRTCIASVSTP